MEGCVCVGGGPMVGRWIVVYSGGGKVPIVAVCRRGRKRRFARVVAIVSNLGEGAAM